MGHKHYRKLGLASVFDFNLAAIATPSRHVGTFTRLGGLRKDNFTAQGVLLSR